MNYYKRHLGDYAKDTRHLSMSEHGAYCLLLDYYYSTEKPIPDDRCERIANAYADFEREAVRAVLQQFFTQTPEGWKNKRADAVISESSVKSLKAKESAEARWAKAQCERNANASKTHSERNASHKPLAITKEIPPAVPADAPIKPSKPKGASGVELQTWIDSLPADQDAIADDDPIFDYADSIGLPADYIALAWAWFKTSMAGKRKKDWRAHFRNAVRNGWPKYWWPTDDGGWRLSPAGEQAKRAMDAQS